MVEAAESSDAVEATGLGRFKMVLIWDLVAAGWVVGLSYLLLGDPVSYLVGFTTGLLAVPIGCVGLCAVIASHVLLAVRLIRTKGRRFGAAVRICRLGILLLAIAGSAAMIYAGPSSRSPPVVDGFWSRIEPRTDVDALRAWGSSLSVAGLVDRSSWPESVRRLDPEWAVVRPDGTVQLTWGGSFRGRYVLVVGPKTMARPLGSGVAEDVRRVAPGAYVFFDPG